MKLRSWTMKLSDKTLVILKNFAGINNSILVKRGDNLRTISLAKNILAEANINEEFPRDFAIYDLNQFLKTLFYCLYLFICLHLYLYLLI